MSMSYPQQLLATFEQYCQDLFTHHFQSELADPVRYSLSSGGKRIRPLLTLLSCEVCGSSHHHALPAAVAIEAVHTFTLIHDDIMDNAELRRNKPTVHKRWDLNTAILAGDMLVPIAYKLIFHSYPTSQAADIAQELTEGIRDVCEGQALDLHCSHQQPSIKRYLQMITLKTCRIFQTAVQLGAVCAGNQPARAILADYAHHLGIAFQIRDDYLDVFGDANSTGKIQGHDLIEGKRTYLIAALYEATVDHLPPLLKQFLDRNGIEPDNVPAMMQLMKEFKIDQQALETIRTHSERALQYLKRLPFSPARQALEDLTATLADRIR